jgi:hypothetical protein
MKDFKLKDMVGRDYTTKAYTRNQAVKNVKKLTGLYVYVVD